MGIKNAPATFQRLMDQVFSGLQGAELFVYLDDIVVFSRTLEEHDKTINRLFGRLRNANLLLQPVKCEFLKTEVSYLGHIISNKGIMPDPRKIKAIQNDPRPCTVKSVLGF